MFPHLQDYEARVAPARARLADGRALSQVMTDTVDPEILELFLMSFSALGVGMTEPVDSWIRRAGERCTALGLTELGRALGKHAAHEAGHHLMMIEDTKKLVAGWNARHQPALSFDDVLGQPPTPGVVRYQQLHEKVIAGPTPYGQLAIEYEIERLSVAHGGALIKHCVAKLGPGIMHGLSFLEEHVAIDAGHTKFNASELDRLIAGQPTFVEPLAAAGNAALEAYGQFLDDCLNRATALKQL